MRPALYTKFVEKAEAALIAAVEIYNKPSFRYREETFSLLAINAWELLLKARLLKDGNNDPKVIRVYEPRKTKTGKSSSKLYLVRNRANNPLTISLSKCIARLDESSGTRLSPELKANIEALVAVRDSAAHYINASPLLAKQVLEIATATVRNFILISKMWFDRNFSESFTLLLPLSFINEDGQVIDSVIVTSGEGNLMSYLQKLADTKSSVDSKLAVAIRVAIKFERSKLTSASKIQVTNDPDAVRVVLTEQNVRERYPWDYKELNRQLGLKYSNFKVDNKYHAIRKPLLSDEKYAHSRFLDPGNPKSGKKDFYSPNIMNIFDRHYSRKK